MVQHSQNANDPIRVYNLEPPRQSNYDKKGSIPYYGTKTIFINWESLFRLLV